MILCLISIVKIGAIGSINIFPYLILQPTRIFAPVCCLPPATMDAAAIVAHLVTGYIFSYLLKGIAPVVIHFFSIKLSPFINLLTSAYKHVEIPPIIKKKVHFFNRVINTCYPHFLISLSLLIHFSPAFFLSPALKLFLAMVRAIHLLKSIGELQVLCLNSNRLLHQ